MLNTNKIILGGTVGVLALGLGGWAVTRRGAGDEIKYKTATVEKGDLKQTVSATGIIQPFTVVDIKSRAGGEVKELPVEIGDIIKPGQLIARIDPTDSLAAYNQAQADVSGANARISQAKQTMSLQELTAQTAIADAEARVRVAESNLASAEQQARVQPTLTEAAIRQARASLRTAEQSLAQIRKGSDPQARADARTALAVANANLKNAELNLTRQQNLVAKGFVAQSAADTALAARDVARAQADAARTRAETVGGSQDAAISAAESRVRESRENLQTALAQRVQVGLRQQDVVSARASVSQARTSLATARANLGQVGIRAADIQTAKSQIARSEAGLRSAKVQLDSTTIRSPRSGVVLQKYVEQGTIIASAQSFSAQGQSVVQIGDLTRVMVDVGVDESDIAQIKKGQKVKVTLDAFPDDEFEGRVRRIDPRGTTDQNVTTIRTQVEITKPDARLRPGLNAECEFIVSEKGDVISVPSKAVRGGKDGKKTVQVLGKDNKPQSVEVETGMEAGDNIEIVKGLKGGEKVVTGIQAPGNGRGGGPGGSGGGPGGAGGGRPGGGGGGMGGFGR